MNSTSVNLTANRVQRKGNRGKGERGRMEKEGEREDVLKHFWCHNA